MKVTVVGSSPAFPNPGSAHTGVLVQASGSSVLLDCGPGVLQRLRERDGWPVVDAIVISHFHLDHWGDLVPWVWGSMHRGEELAGRPELWVYRGAPAQLERFGELLGFPDMFERVFRINEYDDATPFSAAGLEVLPMRLPHYHIETYGFRVRDGDTTFAYSGDSAPSDDLAELARDVDLFLCEATLLDGAWDGPPRGHLSSSEALDAFAASGAKRLVLTHRPFELPVPAGVEVARDGLVVEL